MDNQMHNFSNDLGDLSEPKTFSKVLNVGEFKIEQLLDFFATMYKIRKSEEIIADLYRQGETKTPIHLSIGQEAVATGASRHLHSLDKVYSNHRSHAHYIAAGGSTEALFSEILGKASGASGGMGGSMHLISVENGFMGSVPIVAGTIPVAAGAAIASKFDGEQTVSVAYFGDGACEEGVLHETLNLASVMQLPIIFICENNLYSSHLDIHLRQTSNMVSRFAKAHNIRTNLVDGNDVLAVARAMKEAVDLARIQCVPTFIEAVTFRWRGHVGPNDDIDVGLHRSMEQLSAWKATDPIERLLVTGEQIDAKFRKYCKQKADLIDSELISDTLSARKAEYPDKESLLQFVYEK